MRLVINSSQAVSLDLTNYIRVSDGEGMDPASPAFSEKVISHSLLKEGGFLALEDLKAKELAFPLALNAPLTPVTNLFTQPTVRYGIGAWKTSGFGAMNAGAAASVVADSAAPSGAKQSVQVVTTSATNFQGIAMQFPGTFQSGQPYNVSGFIRGNAGGEPVKIGAASMASGDFGSSATLSPTTSYQRFNFTYTPASTHTDLYVFVITTSATACTFFFDGEQITSGSAVQTYTDGDQLGASWNGPPGNSTSTAPGGLSQSITIVEQLNQAITTPGVTFSWQDTGLSQPTIFDGISGQFDVEYSYRQHEKFWVKGKLRLFAQPFGRTASPRLYATASGVGPLLMISPYASGGANVLGASTQAGISGYGGQQQASGGVFYAGSPELAGDAPAQLQISYVGPLPNQATNAGAVPYVAVSLLPDQLYSPLITVPDISIGAGGSAMPVKSSTAIGSQYITQLAAAGITYSFLPIRGAAASQAPNIAWSGAHRLFAIARASGTFNTGTLQLSPNALTPNSPAQVTVTGWDWSPYDLGVFSLRPSEPPTQSVQIIAQAGVGNALDINAFIMLPDNATWYLNPKGISPSQYGLPPALALQGGFASAPYTNTLVLDDILGDQFVYAGPSQTAAPSPIGSVPSAARITQFSRGLLPRSDPKGGLPILALVGLAQTGTASTTYSNGFVTANQPSAGWSNPQNLRTMAQVNVLERTRYVLP